MLRRVFLPAMFLVLTYGFWVSPDFKVIAAGVAVFLFGMISLEEGFKAFTGGGLERLLQATTNRLWKSIGFGLITTTLMQSSSLVSVITISFLSAGLLGLAQGVGIIFGANLGTTTGAWLIAGFGLKVKIATYAMPMLVFGVLLLFQNRKALKGVGYILTGLGFLFLGIHYMKDGFESFKSAIDLAAYAIPGFWGLLVFTGIGMFATVVMQSSHATLVLTLTALGAGQITYENALALAIGANVGTTITAVLGSISANVQGRRLAGAHVVFNVVTGVIAIAAIHQFIAAVEFVSTEIGIPDDDYTLKLAVFHTLFNLVGILVMLPFIDRMVSILERVLRPRDPQVVRPKFLNDAALALPDAALAAIRKEMEHLLERAFEIMAHGLSLRRQTILSDDDLDELIHAPPRRGDYDIEAHYERDLKTVYGAVIAFISRLRTTADEEHAEQLYAFRNASRGIVEGVKEVKHMRPNLVRYTRHRNRYIRAEYNRLRAELASVMRDVYRLCVTHTQETSALTLDGLKVEIRQMAQDLDDRSDELIRHNRITPDMATSLMNDASYAYSAARALLNAGLAMARAERTGEPDLERELSLEEDEIEQVLNH